MKTRNTLALVAVISMVCYANISCKKLLDKIADCRIETITERSPSGNRVTTIVYNNEGNISTVTGLYGNTNSNKVFNYSGNTIIINSTVNHGSGDIVSMDSVTTDGQGKPLNIRQYRSDRLAWINTRFEYNGGELVRMYQTDESNDPPNITIVTNNDGNLVRLENPSGAAILEYYTNEEFQQGDYLNIITVLLYGVPIYPHKNLIKTIDSGNGNISNFNYEKNTDGLVTKVTVTGGTSVITYEYGYECD